MNRERLELILKILNGMESSEKHMSLFLNDDTMPYRIDYLSSCDYLKAIDKVVKQACIKELSKFMIGES